MAYLGASSNYYAPLITTAGYPVGQIVFGPTTGPSQPHVWISQSTAGTHTLQTESTITMFDELKSADLSKYSLEKLLFLDSLAELLRQQYATRGLDVPEWLPGRRRQMTIAITVAIETEIQRLEQEDEQLKAKEERRKDLAARKAKLLEAREQQA